VYDVSLVRPVTVTGEVADVPTNPPGLEIAAYPLIAEPPTLRGPETGISAEESPAIGVPAEGAFGVFDGS
jgi:hypothetical protein